MRVALVSGNRETMPDAVIPLGLLYLQASLPAEVESELWDLCFEEDPEATLKERLAAFCPEVVALGIRNLQRNDYGGYEETLAYYRRLMVAVRGITSAPVVVGGGGFSVAPELLMRTLEPDFGLCGEGERSFPALLAALQAGKRQLGLERLDVLHPCWSTLLAQQEVALEAIPRLRYHRGAEGGLVLSAAEPSFVALDGLPWPRREAVDPQHHERYGIESLQTKRGCDLHCSYCSYPEIEGREVRRRDPALVVDELLALSHREQPPSHVFIVDAVFNRPREHAKAVCREMRDRGFAIPWTCYITPLGFDLELAEAMVEAGCAGIEVGTDSGCDAVLGRLRKGFDTDAVRELSRLCGEVGLRDCHSFVLATPGESREDVEETLRFCAELDPFAAIMMLWLADTPPRDAAEARRRLDLEAEARALLEERCRANPRWIAPPLGRNFKERQFKVLRRRGLRGPLWQHLER